MKLAILACVLLGWRLDAQALVAIGEVQGAGGASTYVGQRVTVEGVVTARKSNGFFVQTADSEVDADAATSEGIFIFASSAPPAAAAIGNAVRVAGTVAEFQGLTEITGPSVTMLSTGNALPEPVTLAPREDLERYEGMRVRLGSLLVVAPTGGNVSEANATAASNGIFYGVLAGLPRPFREPGVPTTGLLPADAPCCVPYWDGNSERLRVSAGAAAGLDVTAGAVFTDLRGVLDYGAGVYTVLPDAGPVSLSGNIAAGPVRAPEAGEFTIASLNLERFFDTVNDPTVSDVALTPAAYENRLRKAALVIRDVLQTPDILAVQEAENLAVLQDIATRVNASYTAHLIEGNDPGGIDVGILVKSSRVAVLNVTQEGKGAMYTTPSGDSDLLNDRPPLLLRAVVGTFPVTVIVNHLRSLNGIDDPEDGGRVRAKRRAQAEFLAGLIQERQLADPNERIVAVGDFNAFPFNDGYVDVIGTVRGAPTGPTNVSLASPDLVNPDLVDAADSMPAAQQYSYVFDGSAQTLDHMLFTKNLLPFFARLERARSNADFPEVYRNDPARPERLSDHDAAVAYFRLSSAAVGVGIAMGPSPVAGRSVTYSVEVWNTSAAAAANVAISAMVPESLAALPYMTAPAGWTCANALNCVIASLASGARESLTLTFIVRPDALNGAALTVSANASSGAAATSTTMIARPTPGRQPRRVDGATGRRGGLKRRY